MDGGGYGVPSGEIGPIDASMQLGNNGSVKEQFKCGSVVNGQQWWTGGAALGQSLCRTSRHKFITVKHYVVIVVFVG